MGCGSSAPADPEPAAPPPKSAPPAPAKKKSAVADFEGAGLTAFPTSISPDVLELNVASNPELTSLEGIGALTKLTKVDANSGGLIKVPDEIKDCAALKEVLLYACKLTELNPNLGELSELETFNVFNNKIKKLPVQMGKLANLEELNVAANKLMMLTDEHFAGLSGVKILSLYDNNLVRMGSLAPLVALEELRISGNNLEEMPTLGSHPKLTVYEIHKNRISSIAPDYFSATPALQRLSVWRNALTELPPSLLACAELLGVQAQECKLTALPAGAWPASIETIFVQENGPQFVLPADLKQCSNLKRVNVSKLELDDASNEVMEAVKLICLKADSGIFWDPKGRKMAA